MNQIKTSSMALMGLIGVIIASLYSPPANATLLIKNVTEAKSKAGQSCFAENYDFVAVYCNCASQENDDGNGDCRDDSYTMPTSGYCKLPGGGDGIGVAYCVGSLPLENVCSFCTSQCNTFNIANNLHTEEGYSPFVFYYYEYDQIQNGYRCGNGRTKKYTCARGNYAYDIDPTTGRIEECVNCPTITGTDGKNHATTAFPNTGFITSCYAPPGVYKDKTGTFELSADCYYSK